MRHEYIPAIAIRRQHDNGVGRKRLVGARAMKIGFTGTRRGMTEAQKESVIILLNQAGCTELHHGDCVGADEDAHNLALAVGIPIVIHPPNDAKLRAYCPGTLTVTTLATKPYKDRNHDIVNQTDALIGAPYQNENVTRSGTWATIRYAQKHAKPVWLVLPDGALALKE
jgi:hypothetical protein